MNLTLARSFPADLKSFQEPEKAGSVTVPMIPTKTLKLREVKELLLGLPASACHLGCEARCAQQHQVLCERGGLPSGSLGYLIGWATRSWRGSQARGEDGGGSFTERRRLPLSLARSGLRCLSWLAP